MATYDSNLQAAVDATSLARDSGEKDLVAYLKEQLTDREIETNDQDWVERTVQRIRENPNYMIEDEPDDYRPQG